MNRLKFSEGGQPVYLDDLRLLQDNDVSAMKFLLQALGNGQKTFLLQPLKVEGLKPDESGTKTEFIVKAGTAVVDGEFMAWNDTSFQIGDWNTPIYLCIRTTNTDNRLFEDGQERNCRTSKEAYLSLDKDGATEYYPIYDLPVLFDVIKDVVGYKEPVWRQIKVHFFNGYTGTVRFKELAECYRVWVDIKSDIYEEIEGDIMLFYTDITFLQNFRSSCIASIVSENGVQSCQLHGFEGTVRLDILLPVDDLSCAAEVPVKIVFEIPK